MRALPLLIVAQLRRDRWQLTLWVVGISLLGFAAANAIATEFASEADRRAIVAIASANPAFLFLRGTPDGTGIGALAYFQAFTFISVLAGFMNTFLVVRHSRGDESLGRAELIGSTPAGRQSPLIATLAVALFANVALASLVGLAFLVAGEAVWPSFLVGIGAGSVGFFFAAVAATVAQLTPSSRMANGVSSAIVGLAYFARGIGDALGDANSDLTRVDSAWISLLSPIGWAQRSRPFSDADPTLLVPVVFAALALAVFAVFVRARRDLGSSLFADRQGPAVGGNSTRSPIALAFRLQRGTIVGWATAGAFMGIIAGALGSVVADITESNGSLRDLIAQLAGGADPDILEVFAAAIIGITGVLAAAAGIQAVVRLREEEAAGHAELLLSTPLRRLGWFAAQLVVAGASVFVVLAVAGIAAGVSLAVVGRGAGSIGTYVIAALAHAPASLVFVGLAGLVFGLLPRLTTALSWGLLVIALVLGQFGELLQLPQWLQDASPFAHSSAMPVDELNVLAVVVLVGIAFAMAALAAALVRRRDILP